MASALMTTVSATAAATRLPYTATSLHAGLAAAIRQAAAAVIVAVAVTTDSDGFGSNGRRNTWPVQELPCPSPAVRVSHQAPVPSKRDVITTLASGPAAQSGPSPRC
ncbi:hypothetical protein GCM10020358_59750 [Amorphoplanes nipponensis]|uniref:Uncharacterized protein n=1 Tax=Actinoplanes nipponensis TaxID=135950 RepID=A0A919MM17_9ACTN|nr:hypothetical protein Ani05nite_04870 [Actinoplanes nipponensis]